MRLPARSLAPVLIAVAGLLAAPAAALAKSADVVDADVRLRLAPDSSLLVSETLGFDYEGAFHASCG